MSAGWDRVVKVRTSFYVVAKFDIHMLLCVYACTAISCFKPCHYMKIFPTCKSYFFQIHDLQQLHLKNCSQVSMVSARCVSKEVPEFQSLSWIYFFVSLGWHERCLIIWGVGHSCCQCYFWCLAAVVYFPSFRTLLSVYLDSAIQPHALSSYWHASQILCNFSFQFAFSLM